MRTLQLLLCAALLKSAAILASEAGLPNASHRPFVGTWNPTSFREEMNVGNLIIGEHGLRVESSGSYLEFRLVSNIGGIDVVEVTKRNPRNAFQDTNALAFRVERDSYGRDLLWITYCGSLKDCAQLRAGNSYMRRK